MQCYTACGAASTMSHIARACFTFQSRFFAPFQLFACFHFLCFPCFTSNVFHTRTSNRILQNSNYSHENDAEISIALRIHENYEKLRNRPEHLLEKDDHFRIRSDITAGKGCRRLKNAEGQRTPCRALRGRVRPMFVLTQSVCLTTF